jgi:hypothetical protein
MLAGHICLFGTFVFLDTDMIPKIQWTPKKHWHMGKITPSNIAFWWVDLAQSQGISEEISGGNQHPKNHLFWLQDPLKQQDFEWFFPAKTWELQEACLRGDLGLVKRLIAANASVTRKKMAVGRWIHFVEAPKKMELCKMRWQLWSIEKKLFFSRLLYIPLTWVDLGKAKTLELHFYGQGMPCCVKRVMG